MGWHLTIWAIDCDKKETVPWYNLRSPGDDPIPDLGVEEGEDLWSEVNAEELQFLSQDGPDLAEAGHQHIHCLPYVNLGDLNHSFLFS